MTLNTHGVLGALPILTMILSCTTQGPPTSQSVPEIQQHQSETISAPPVPESQSKITPETKPKGKHSGEPCDPRSKPKGGNKSVDAPESGLLRCPPKPVSVTPTRK